MSGTKPLKNQPMTYRSQLRVILDTNVLRAVFREAGKYPLLESRIKHTPYEQLYISIVSVEEVLRGTLELFRRHERDLPAAYRFIQNVLLDLARFQIISFDEHDDRKYQAMPPGVRRHGKRDCRIAASALARGYKVITRNLDDFKAIGVDCEDWFVA
ncbi:MAG TPA: type II toxin-antitoxin system VapC family toxin [Blastocatellia bacterium]|nr:type II toxin-antitoxin system VapC family toxin [Blastocatellia bacterium]